MERKIKHRILGGFAIAALVIILLPLFQSGNESTIETKLVKAPPFPDQSVQVATPLSASPDHPVIPVQSPQAAENDAVEPTDLMSAARPTVVNEISPMDTAISQTEESPQAKVTEVEPMIPSESDDFKTSVTNEVSKPKESNPFKTIVKKSKHIEKSEKTPTVIKVTKFEKKRTSVAQTPLTDNGLIELKNAVWVIQIGSFKNKANALRLVNQLRANGYRAFIQQVSNTFGENTRVFVGPEYKHNSARALATRLESDMHIRGIVISYKPLAL
jgi:DedD protein